MMSCWGSRNFPGFEIDVYLPASVCIIRCGYFDRRYWMKTRGMDTPRGVLLEHLKGGSYSSESWDRAYYRQYIHIYAIVYSRCRQECPT